MSISTTSDPTIDTPITYCERGRYWLKRDDLFVINESCGGKARACLVLANTGGRQGLVTAGARHSPQIQIVARVAEHLGVSCRCHTASGQMTPELLDAQSHGAEILQHRPGYNSVIVSRAENDSMLGFHGWTYIPFGMESRQAIDITRVQARTVPLDMWSRFNRVVIAIGSGITTSGLLWGMQDMRVEVPVLGIAVGRDPVKTLNWAAPAGWRRQLTIQHADEPYQMSVEAEIDGVPLDPIYEAKAASFVEAGDLFWIIGARIGVGNLPTE